MTKRTNIFTLLLIVGFALPFNIKAQHDTLQTNKLGLDILMAIKQNDEQKILKITVDFNEIDLMIDQSALPDSVKTKTKVNLIAEMKSHQKEHNEKVLSEYKNVVKALDSVCIDSLSLGKVSLNIHPLINMGLELGVLEIEFKCGEITRIIEVNLIHSLSGWRIMEHIGIKK